MSNHLIDTDRLEQSLDRIQLDIQSLYQKINSCLGRNENAVSASKLASGRKISLTGGVTGSTTFDGSKDVSIPTILTAHTHTADEITMGVLPVTRGGTGASDDTGAIRNIINGNDIYPNRIEVGYSNWSSNNTFGLHMHNSDIVGINNLVWEDASPPEGLYFPYNATDTDGAQLYDLFYLYDGAAYLRHGARIDSGYRGTLYKLNMTQV